MGGTLTSSSSAQVDDNGDATFIVSPAGHTIYTAVSSGDAWYGSATSSDFMVLVYASVQARMIGGYATRGQYRLYHDTARCGRKRIGCPISIVSVAPNEAGIGIDVHLYVKNGRRWALLAAGSGRLSSASTTFLLFRYKPHVATGQRFRIVWSFSNPDHALASATNYFGITS